MDDNEIKITFGGVEIGARVRNFEFTEDEQAQFDRAAKETLNDPNLGVTSSEPFKLSPFKVKTLTITLVYQRPKVRFFYWLPKTRSCRAK
jgi:hypothetical protein